MDLPESPEISDDPQPICRGKLQHAEPTGESFEYEPELNIDPHAQKAFGAFQNDVEYGEVVRKSKPAVASHAGPSGPALHKSWMTSPTTPLLCGLTHLAI